MFLFYLKLNIFGMYVINRKIFENKMIGIVEINLLWMVFKYMLCDNFLKNGFFFLICVINFCIIVIIFFYKILINVLLNFLVKLLLLNGFDYVLLLYCM